MTPEHQHPHTMLSESIRAFNAEIEDVTRRLAGLDSPGEETAAAMNEAVSQLHDAQGDLAAQEHDLRDLLEAERLRYRDLFEWAPDAYLVTDPGGKVLEANRAAEELLGRSRKLVIGKPMATLLAPEDRRTFRTMAPRLAGLNRVTDWELVFERRDHRSFPAAVTVSLIRDMHGLEVGFRWLIRDVSERRETEQQMVTANIELERRVRERTAELEALAREREEAFARLEAVLDQIPAAIVIADAASGKVVAANEHAVRLVSDVVGGGDALEQWLSIGYHADGTRYGIEERPIMRALSDGGSVKPQEIEFHRLDGTRALYETSAAPIRNADGQVVAAVAAYWDLTERVLTARAERDFITNAAHELRTPLAALASAVEVLQQGAKEDPADRDRFLAHIEEQSERLQRLVRSLLLLARLQTLREKAEREPLRASALLEAVADLAPADRVRLELGKAADALVLTNRDLAEQALLNLVSNAVKYAPGEVVLRTDTANGYIALEVVDSGPGMSPDQIERARDRFYRGRDDPGGFGLGLSIAQQAAEALEGRLELESDGERGTRARLLLPLAETRA